VQPEDFQDDSYDICPTADPVATTQQEKLLKAQALMELMPSGMLDPLQVIQRVLAAQEQPDWEKLIPGMAETGQPQPPPPPPDPKMLEMEKKAELADRAGAQKMQQAQEKHAMDMQSAEAKLQQQAQSDAMEREHEATMLKLKTAGEVTNQRIFMADAAVKHEAKKVEAQQKLDHNQQMGDQKLAQAKKQAQVSSKNGKGASSQKPSSKKSGK